VKAKLGKRDQALELFKKVIELNPKDYEANLEIGQLFEQSDSRHALIYYENGVDLLKAELEKRKAEHGPAGDETDFIKPELMLNIGVFRLEIGKDEEAKEAFLEAKQTIDAILKMKEGNPHYQAMRLTCKFNLAYWFEEHNQLGEATEKYKQIIKEEPHYVDAYLRLGLLAKKRGNMKRAEEYFEMAKSYNPKKGNLRPTNQFCMLGHLHHENADHKNSLRYFEHVRKEFNKADSYAVMGIANIEYEASIANRSKPQEKYLQSAMERYLYVLEHDEANAYATLGIANVLAEYGKFEEASEIYKVLRDTCPEMPHAMVNSAHLLVERKSYEQAIVIY